MRILVTGGSGFLGGSAVAALTRAGHEVVGGDLRPPADAAAAHRPLDVTDPMQVDDVFAEIRPEVVVHLAAIVNPGRSPDRERERVVDVGGTATILRACRDHGVRRLVVSSSGAAYGYHPDNGAAHGGWLTEEDPLRGNAEFAYSDHKRQVEELLAQWRVEHPGLEQVVLRIGTILGVGVDNQITALFRRPRLLMVRGHDSPFVFAWDHDVVAAIEAASTGGVVGAFNVAGDGALGVREIADLLGRPVLAVPDPLLRAALRVARTLRLTPYGPEQTIFLKYRPVLDNTRLKEVLGVTPTRTSRQAFEEWARSAGLLEPDETTAGQVDEAAGG